MKPVTPNNFQRFAERYPEHAREMARLEKLIMEIADAEIRDRVRGRVNVELGIVLLKNQEVGEAIAQLFRTKLNDILELRDFTLDM
jgi:hypothetical protein